MDDLKALKTGENKEIDKSANRIKKYKRKGNSEKYKMSLDKSESLLCFDLNKCCYCSKVFVNPTFLIKHVLRRHSDKLRKMQKDKESDCNNPLSYKDLMQFIIYTFSKFHKELESTKNFFASQTFLCNAFHNKYINLSTGKLESILKDGSEYVPWEMTDLKSKLSKIEEDVLHIEEDFNRFKSALKISEESVLDETKLYNKLKESLLFEFQSTILENSENNLIFMRYISDLRTEIERLKFFIKVNSEKIDNFPQSVSSEVKQELEDELKKELENKLSMYLNNREDVKYKNSKKETVQTLQDSFNVSQIVQKKKRHKNKLLNLPKKPHIRKAMHLNSTGVEFHLDKKFKNLNISSGMERLSTSDYDSKMILVQAEKENLSKKYKSFSKIRRSLDSYSEEIVLSRLKDRKSKKKLRFLLPENITTNSENDFSSNSNLDICCAVTQTAEQISCITAEKRKTHNSSASLKLFDYKNKCKLPDISYNSVEELSPVCIFEPEKEP